MKFNVQELQDFFLEAAAETYAGNGSTKGTIPDIPGSRRYWYQKGKLVYLDVYVINGEYSGGQTLLYVSGVPAWLMQYQGWCQEDNKEVLDFLKKALLDSYMAKEFRGGRGPQQFEDDQKDGVFYQNNPKRFEDDFELFRGRERIAPKNRHGLDLFWHNYQGQLLGDPE